MRQVILHIGMHKTGTTSIQNALHKVNRDGFRTVRFAEKNHSLPMWTIFSEKEPARYFTDRGLTDSEIEEKKAEYEKILLEEIADESVNVFLLSGEEMSTLTERVQEKVCKFFYEKNLKVRVVYVVRDPISWAASALQEAAKHGEKALSRKNPDYKKRVSGFVKACGKENISTFKYEELIQGGLIKSFSEIIGVELEEGERKNESVTSEALALIYALNNLPVPTRGSKTKFAARKDVLGAFMSFFSQSNGFKKLKLPNIGIVDESVAEDLVWLEKNFGISYQQQDRAESEELVFEDYPSSEALSELFERYSLNFDTSLSLVENVEKLYVMFLRFSEIDLQRNSLVKEEKWLDALYFSKKAIDLGDKRHSAYRQASDISHRLKKIDDAITFAKQAVNATDNNDKSRTNHKEHLVKMLRVAGKLDDALSAVEELIQADEMRFSAHTKKANILLDMQQVEEAKAAIQRSIELGDKRHSAYRQASNICYRLKEIDDAITFAKKAVNAADNTDTSRVKHKEHLAKMLRVAGKHDDALSDVDQKT